jgi:hypothetical protein
MAQLLSLNGKLRLTLPEAYETHRRIIEWDSRFSEDRIPDRSVGLDPVGVKLMRWALKSWGRVRFLNSYLGGTLLPRAQLDFIPAVACAGHFVIIASKPPTAVGEYIEAGRMWQRLWLTATRHGLWSQAEMTPLIFRSYLRDGVEFTKDERSIALARTVSDKLDALLPPGLGDRAVVMGRIGAGPAPAARSVRLPVEALTLS